MITLPDNAPKRRLDRVLVECGLFQTRSRARDAIVRGTVSVDGAVAQKPGLPVGPGGVLSVADPAQRYVSRGALKLIAGLDLFAIDAAGSTALDVGASTGGFTQVLLERGARRVCAIDVGRGQLDEAVSNDPRVTSTEGFNARDLGLDTIGGEPPDLVVSDVSFISLKLALPPALRLAESGARGVFLVKPQFEAGREAMAKGGMLRNPQDADRIAGDLSGWLETNDGWRSLGIRRSPIKGRDGNREFLLGGIKDR